MKTTIPIDWLQIEASPTPTIPRAHVDCAEEAMRRTIKAMRPGSDDSFVASHVQYPYRAAKKVGAKVRTWKLNGEGWRVWRTS